MKKPKKKPFVTILIPAYNEENNIQRIVADSLKLTQYQLEIIVPIDQKTTDKTHVIAKTAGAKVLKNKMGYGKGAIVKSSIKYLRGDYIIQIDADYQFIPKDIPKLIDPLINGYDVALGTRYEMGAHVQKGSVTHLKRFGSYVLSMTTSIFIGQRVTDVMAGFKAFKRKVLIDLAPETNHFGYEAELVIKAAQRKYKIKNIPITYKKRIVGSSNVHMIKHGLLVLATIIKYSSRMK